MSIPVIKPSVEAVTDEQNMTKPYDAWEVWWFSTREKEWLPDDTFSTREEAMQMAKGVAEPGAPCIILHIEFPAVPL